MRRHLSLVLVTVILLLTLFGCGAGGGTETKDEREQVTIALWSDQLTEQYGEYLQEMFPEVDFIFYVATNSTDFYRFKEEHGDLPDILTVRRFALRDVADWKDSLMDLSDTDLANTFHQSYLRSYTYDDGTVNWLPACAEVDGIIINKTMLAKNEIPMPTNYEEFVSACAALRERGIQPFASNFSADYTCMEILQGLSASVLTSQEGREWRQRYESGQTNQLSEEVWLPIFERMEEFIEYAGITSDDLVEKSSSVFDRYTEGETAMMRGTGEDAARYGGVDRESLLMPYYGETEEENWYLTYPAFQMAASVRAEESEEREALILDIMSTMLNEEGLRRISSTQNMIPYNSGVTIDLTPSLSAIEPYIDSNRLYIRLASADMFSISKQVVGGMISGEYADARAAYAAFNEALMVEREEAPVAAHIETGYPYVFEAEGGNPAASAVLNSVREEVETDLLIGQASCVAGNVLAGDYTEEELRFLTMGESPSILICQMTGAQISEYMDYVLNMQGKRGSVINDSTLYVSSGFEMVLKKTAAGYSVEKLTVEGEEMHPKTVYSVAVLGCGELTTKEALESVGVSEYTATETAYKQIIVERLAGGGQLAEPSKYIKVVF